MDEMEERISRIMHTMGVLGKQEQEVMMHFNHFMMGVKRDSHIDHKTKELVALGMSITAKCKYCITMHVKNCLEAGATVDEIMDICYLAIMMGGTPAMAHVVEVVRSLDSFKSEDGAEG